MAIKFSKPKKPTKTETAAAEDRFVSELALALAAVARNIYDEEQKRGKNSDSKLS